MGHSNLFTKSSVLLLYFLVVLINSQVFARPSSPEAYTAWEIIHLEDGIRHGSIPNFSKIHESQHSHLVYDQDHSVGAKLLQSSPGCPEPFEGSPWVYFYHLVGDEPQLKCYLAGFTGPCPAKMRLYPQSSSYYGYCDCSCKQYFGYQVNIPRSYCIGISEPYPRTIAFDKETDTCQILFEQGPCKEEEWLVFGDDPTAGPICETRRCPSVLGEDFFFFDFKTRECHRLGEECNVQQKSGLGILTNNTNEDSYETHYQSFIYTYQLQENNWMPECQIDTNHQQVQYNYYSNKILNLDCKKYERFSKVLNRCVQVIPRRFGLG